MTDDEKKKKGEIEKRDKGGPLAAHDYGDDAGKGWEGADKDDFKIPFLSQLQSLSPELQEDDPKYVDGAKAGMFINSVTRELFAGEEGVILVPCARQHNVVEWQKRAEGGGFVGVHDPRSEVVTAAKERAGGDVRKMESVAGNELVDTFMLYCLRLKDADAVEPEEVVVLSFSKTKIARYREIMTRLSTMKGSQNVPLFAHRLVMTSTRERGPEGPYFNVRLQPAVGDDVRASLIDPAARADLLAAGRTLRDSVIGGTARASYGSKDGPDDEVFA